MGWQHHTSRALAVMRSNRKALVAEKGMSWSSDCGDSATNGSSSSRHASAVDALPMPATAVIMHAVAVTSKLY